MKKMNKYLIVLTVTSFLFGIIQITSAQSGYGKGLNKPGMQGREFGPQQAERHMWIPDMSEEQREQIKELRTAHLKDVQSMKSELKINKARMDALMIEDDPGLNDINKLIEESGAIQIELRKKSASHKLEIRKLLTDEQKLFLDNRKGRRNDRF